MSEHLRTYEVADARVVADLLQRVEHLEEEMARFKDRHPSRLTVAQAADYLGVSSRTLARWRCEGTGPSYVKRGRIYYEVEELDRWRAGGQRLRNTAGGEAR